eukprot:jgi/Chrzof1/6714/Cz19g06180.t1
MALEQQGVFILGLTGSIGMGKSTVSGFFREHGIPVLEADDVVYSLYAKGGAAVGPIGAAFPSAVVDGSISRPALSACVIGDESAMKQLEAIVHPLVEQERLQFLRKGGSQGHQLVVFDIPLLYETGAQAQCDAVAVASAPADVQRERVMARPGMSEAKYLAILDRQVTDSEKRSRADFIIDTGCSLQETEQHVVALIDALKGRTGTAYQKALRRQQQQQQQKL